MPMLSHFLTRLGDLSPTGIGRIVLLTVLGTGCCIGVAFLVDSVDWSNGQWRWGEEPINNILIPLLLAPPFFGFLLSKQRQLALAHKELVVLAATDPLTNCLNRRAFAALIDTHLSRIHALGSSGQGALLLIDIDHFKTINDTFGHDWGDKALVVVAERIKSALSSYDVLSRMGGEEFGVLVAHAHRDNVHSVAEHIRTQVAREYLELDGREHAISVSIGGVLVDETATFDRLYAQADRLLYSAKSGGRNRCRVARSLAPAQHAIG